MNRPAQTFFLGVVAIVTAATKARSGSALAFSLFSPLASSPASSRRRWCGFDESPPFAAVSNDDLAALVRVPFRRSGIGHALRAESESGLDSSSNSETTAGAGAGAAATEPPACPPNANIVLRPSTGDTSLFDSFAIGTARVHRYVRDLDGTAPSDQQAEYVMWYHGRCHDLNANDKALPPLSTGRIGRATSRNGLHWEKCPLGSASEEGEGVSLGLNSESWWGFDTAHVGLGQVMLPMSTPAVLAEGGVYLMYYMGGSHEESPVANYLADADADADAVPADATIRGMALRIGVAVSQDGMTWGRVEGDDPTGACVAPYDKSDPNMRSVPFMRDDDDSLLDIEEELYCGWPDVVVNRVDNDDDDDDTDSFSADSNSFSSMRKKPPAFFMYYSTMLKNTKEKAIACAVSEDGFRWSKRGVVLRPDATSDDALDAAGCARCTVVRREQTAPLSAGKQNTGRTSSRGKGGWVMYYEGISKKDNKHRIMSAESDDGRNWVKTGLVLDVGDETLNAWDCNGVGSPHILRLDDGARRMYYTGQAKDGSTAIGVAKCVGKGFVREQVEISFE